MPPLCHKINIFRTDKPGQIQLPPTLSGGIKIDSTSKCKETSLYNSTKFRKCKKIVTLTTVTDQKTRKNNNNEKRKHYKCTNNDMAN